MHFDLLVKHMLVESEQSMTDSVLGCLLILEDFDADYFGFEIFEVNY
jgi:hypothetical protein